jgi:hypothetical protein
VHKSQRKHKTNNRFHLKFTEGVFWIWWSINRSIFTYFIFTLDSPENRTSALCFVINK